MLCSHRKEHGTKGGPPRSPHGECGRRLAPTAAPAPSGQRRPEARGKRRRYLVDGGVLPQRQVPEAAAHLVPALAHCKGERHGSGTGRRRRGGPWAPQPLTLHHHRLGHDGAGGGCLLFRTWRPEATPPQRPRRSGGTLRRARSSNGAASFPPPSSRGGTSHPLV